VGQLKLKLKYGYGVGISDFCGSEESNHHHLIRGSAASVIDYVRNTKRRHHHSKIFGRKNVRYVSECRMERQNCRIDDVDDVRRTV
jgi:hypothetical protein